MRDILQFQQQEQQQQRLCDIVNPCDGKAVDEFRDYESNVQTENVRKTYAEMHEKQTMEFVKRQREKWLKLNHTEMTVMDAIMLLDDFVDESDPDIDLPNSVHAFQTAERIRERHPDKDWYQLTGLIHDIGKVIGMWGEPQWCTVGDTFPVGCQFENTCVFHESFEKNPDFYNPLYNTKNGIYTEGCGLDDVTFSWGHDEYMYQVLVENNTTIPEEGLYCIRYHSFYPYHSEGGYKHLCNEKDRKMLPRLRDFNSYDLYSKSEDIPDVEALKPYYQSLIDKYIPGKIRF